MNCATKLKGSGEAPELGARDLGESAEVRSLRTYLDKAFNHFHGRDRVDSSSSLHL